MSKQYDEMTVGELREHFDRTETVNGTSNHSLAQYIQQRAAQEEGRTCDAPYDSKTEHGEGVQGPR